MNGWTRIMNGGSSCNTIAFEDGTYRYAKNKKAVRFAVNEIINQST
jgi:hypothetical protein